MTKVSITYDCIEEAQTQGLVIDESSHLILPEGPWLREVKRRTGLDNLFLYYHLYNDTFVIAGWAIPPHVYGRGVAIELEVFEGHPDHLHTMAPSIEWMVTRTAFVENPYISMQRRLKAIRDRRTALQENVRENTAEMVRSIM